LENRVRLKRVLMDLTQKILMVAKCAVVMGKRRMDGIRIVLIVAKCAAVVSNR